MAGTKNIFRLLNKLNPDDPELTNDAVGDLENAAAVNTIAQVLSKLEALQSQMKDFQSRLGSLQWVVGLLAVLVLASVGWLLAISWQTQRDIAALAVRMETIAARVETLSTRVETIAAQQSNPPPPPPVEDTDDEDEREEQVRASAAN